jgi:L-ascorbate 6-phosphate lactonase
LPEEANQHSLLSKIEDPARSTKVTIWGLSGAGFVIRSFQDVVYLDPYLVPPEPSRPQHRAYPVPFPPDRVNLANAILSTHEHEDHCNVQTLLGIRRNTDAVFVGPKSAAKKAIGGGYPDSRVLTVAPGQEQKISPNLKLYVFESRDPYEPQAVMYLIQTPKGNIFHSGDSAYFEGFKKVGQAHKVDVALINFGKQIPTPEKPYYMDANSFSKAARDLDARNAVPMHWNLWAETKEDPSPIKPILQEASPKSKFRIIDYGQEFEL